MADETTDHEGAAAVRWLMRIVRRVWKQAISKHGCMLQMIEWVERGVAAGLEERADDGVISARTRVT